VAEAAGQVVRVQRRPWNDEVLDFLREISEVGVSATVTADLYGDALSAWAAELAESWRGWDGVRRAVRSFQPLNNAKGLIYCIGRVPVSGGGGSLGGRRRLAARISRPLNGAWC
jgi:hypothetical protein